MKQEPTKFVLSHNGREDNLGDQVLLASMTRILQRQGVVVMRQNSSEADIHARVVGAPGARLWDAVTHRPRMIPGSLVAGVSVIPKANHNWTHQFEWVGVRDEFSLHAIRDAGHLNVAYFPDLSFEYDRTSLNLIDDPFDSAWLSFRSAIPENAFSPKTTDSLLSSIGPIVEECGRESLRVFHQVTEDEGFSRRVAETFGLGRRPDKLAMSSYSDHFARAGVVFSNRLHALLLSAVCGGVPVAVVERDHHKVIGLFRSVGWDNLIIPADAPPEQIRRHIREIRNSASEVRMQVRESVARQSQLIRSHQF